jgi:GT2 family glycosyltransferase
MSTSVSVIVATYNRARLLEECLDHLGRQRFAPGDEVIIVDNGSTDTTGAVVAGRQVAFPAPLRSLTEARPGKSHAVAAALVVAAGDVLAFTDDDVNVDAGWLDAIRSAMDEGPQGGRVDLVGGPVRPRWERRAPFWLNLGDRYGRLAAPLALLDYGADVIDLGPRTALGANLAVRHDVIRQIGGFAPHLGKLRGTLLSGEDHDLCRRAQRAGFRAMYCPAAVVRHWVPADRVRVRYFLEWFFWSGITSAVLDESERRQMRTLFGVPRHFVRRFVASAVGAMTAAATWRWHTAVDRATDAAFAAGYAARRWGAV